VSTLTTLLIGTDNLVKQSSIDSLVYFQAPSALVGLVVLSIYARVQKPRTLLHLTAAVVISEILGFVILSVLMGKLYFAPTWAIDLFIAAFTILAATYIGSHFRGVNEKAT
jgi:hypothetical protein